MTTHFSGDVVASLIGDVTGDLAGAVVASALNIKAAVIADAAAGEHTVTGITTDDTLLAVVGFTLALTEGEPNTIAFTAVNLTSEFTISEADKIDNTDGTALTDGVALVLYLDAG